MKLDNKPPILRGSFDLYAIKLGTFLKRIGVWGVLEDDAVMGASISSTPFALMNNLVPGM